MSGTLTSEEAAQLQQTIDMFEAIAQSQPHDFQSLEILKEAYLKLGRNEELLDASRRIADAYVQMGQLSSAILEYETILQRFPESVEIRNALAQIESQATGFGGEEQTDVSGMSDSETPQVGSIQSPTSTEHLDDGAPAMRKLFVDGKHISASEFDLCWPSVSALEPGAIQVPFVQNLVDKNMMPLEKALKLLIEKSRLCYMPLELYDIQIDLARSYSADVCRRWCVLPIDKIGTTVIVATTNPFSVRAVQELQQSQPNRIHWYLSSPVDLTREIKKAFR